MNHRARRLASLLIIFTMLCQMVPLAIPAQASTHNVSSTQLPKAQEPTILAPNQQARGISASKGLSQAGIATLNNSPELFAELPSSAKPHQQLPKRNNGGLPRRQPQPQQNPQAMIPQRIWNNTAAKGDIPDPLAKLPPDVQAEYAATPQTTLTPAPTPSPSPEKTTAKTSSLASPHQVYLPIIVTAITVSNDIQNPSVTQNPTAIKTSTAKPQPTSKTSTPKPQPTSQNSNSPSVTATSSTNPRQTATIQPDLSTATAIAKQTATTQLVAPTTTTFANQTATIQPVAPTDSTATTQPLESTATAAANETAFTAISKATPSVTTTPKAEETSVTTTSKAEETPVVSADAVELKVSPELSGTLTSRDGKVQLILPTGAVTQETTIRYAPLPPQKVSGYQEIGPAFQLLAWNNQGTRITHFNADLTLTVQYSPTNEMNEQAIALFYFKDNRYWQRISTTVNTTTQQIVAKVDHFCKYNALKSWSKGDKVGLCKGTPIHQGPGLAVHTIVPENDWLVKVTTDDPRETYNTMGEPEHWWDTSRKDLDQLSTSGTGWVSEIEMRISCDGVSADQAQAYLGLAPLSPARRALLRRLGYLPWMEYPGDPIASSGNFVQQKTDLHVPGIANFDLDLTRVYNSQDDRDGPFGIGWSSILSMSLRIANDGSIDVRYPDGHGAWFEADGGESYVPGDKGINDTLKTEGEELVLSTPAQISYYFNQPKGQLLRLKDRHGNTITFERDAKGNATTIKDSAERSFTLTYNEKKHVEKITDPAGRTLAYTYNDKGDLTSFTDANGGTSNYEYDEKHLLTSLTDPEGIKYLQNTYDDKQRVTEQIDASGSHSKASYTESQTVFTDNLNNATTYDFDDRYRVTKITDALGQSETLTYDENDNLTSQTDKNGKTWQYTYDEKGKRLSETDPQGHPKTYTYNDKNDLTNITDLGGPGNTSRKTTLVYNDKGDLTQIDLPDATTIQATYDAKGQMLSSTNPNGNKTTFSYSDQGNLIDLTDPLGHHTRSEYDTVGRQTSMTDANEHKVTFTLDNKNNVTSITDPKGQKITLAYDKNDLLKSMVDRRGGVKSYKYDENLKLLAETDPEGHTTKHSYDKMYNRISTTNARGFTTNYRYDATYRLVEVEDALNGKTKFTYDPNGNILSVVNALNYTTNFAYDELNQLVQITDALQGITTLDYDAVGRVTAMLNPRKAAMRHTYDLLDRVIKTTDALNGEWTISYDKNGNSISKIDANGHSSTKRYDAADRLIEQQDSEGHITSFVYDAVGNTISVTNARGFATLYTYDENDNLTKITEPKAIDGQNALTTATYDAEDTIIALTDPNLHTTKFTRNLDGLIVKVTEAGGQTTLSDYDVNHNMVKVTNAKGNAWSFTYDALDRRTTIIDPLSYSTRTTYDALSRPIRVTDANSISTRYDYDALNRLIAVVQNELPGTASDYQTNVTTRYGYDSVSNLIQITDANSHLTSFDYDLLDRLLKETNPLAHTWTFTYDKVGNLITRTDAENQTITQNYDKDNLLIKKTYPDSTSVSFAYDAVHNQTVMTDTIGITTNGYDEVDQLLTSKVVPTKLPEAITKAVTYTYDLDHNRVRMAYPDGRVVRYVFDNTDYMTGAIDPDNNVFTATRDLTHNIIKVENPNDTYVEREIDAAERLTAVQNFTNQNPHEIISSFNYTLDPVGNRTRVESTYRWRKPTNLNYNYVYDPLYRLTRSTDSENHFTNYGYDAVGNRILHVTNDDPTLKREIEVMTTTLTFDDANEMLATVKEVSPRGNADRAEQAAQALRAFAHEVAAQAGNHIASTTATSLISQTTTLVDGLEAKKPLTVAAAATEISALQTAVETAGATGTITKRGTVTSLLAKLRRAADANAARGPELHVALYDYDKNGNRIRRTEHREVSATQKDWLKTDYFYDYENRITHVQDFHTPGTPGNGTWLPLDETFVYFDGYGRVYRRQHDQHIAGGGQQEWLDYAYDGLDPIAEYDHPSPQYTNYYRGLGHILSMHEYKSQQSPVGTLSYFHYDGLDSVTGLTKHQGQSVHNLRYNDYGILLDINGQAADSSNFTDPHNHYTYTGQEWDEHLDLYHFYARDYEPATGVWLQQDPYRGQLSDPKTLHRLGYVGGNPTTWRDWLGYNWFEDLWNQFFGSKKPAQTPTPAPKKPTQTPAPTPMQKVLKVPEDIKQGRNECGPTALTIVLRYKGGNQNKDDVVKYAIDKGYFLPNDPKEVFTSPANLVELANHYGTVKSGQKGDQNILVENIKQGKPIIVDVREGLKTEGYTHFVVVKGITNENGVTMVEVQDPEGKVSRVTYKVFEASWISVKESNDKVDRWWLVME